MDGSAGLRKVAGDGTRRAFATVAGVPAGRSLPNPAVAEPPCTGGNVLDFLVAPTCLDGHPWAVDHSSNPDDPIATEKYFPTGDVERELVYKDGRKEVSLRNDPQYLSITYYPPNYEGESTGDFHVGQRQAKLKYRGAEGKVEILYSSGASVTSYEHHPSILKVAEFPQNVSKIKTWTSYRHGMEKRENWDGTVEIVDKAKGKRTIKYPTGPIAEEVRYSSGNVAAKIRYRNGIELTLLRQEGGSPDLAEISYPATNPSFRALKVTVLREGKVQIIYKDGNCTEFNPFEGKITEVKVTKEGKVVLTYDSGKEVVIEPNEQPTLEPPEAGAGREPAVDQGVDTFVKKVHGNDPSQYGGAGEEEGFLPPEVKGNNKQVPSMSFNDSNDDWALDFGDNGINPSGNENGTKPHTTF